MTDMERDLVLVFNQMYRALDGEARGLPAVLRTHEMQEARRAAIEVAERYAHACRVCGEATMLDVCEDCQAEAVVAGVCALTGHWWREGEEGCARCGATATQLGEEQAEAEAEARGELGDMPTDWYAAWHKNR